ncbi:MAG: UvrD-helicase domain-containing protein [Candidatus Hydrogenedentes bacterium]|nr:UvrD-helicase domain-containing protein [Candidatus Hydrogenedentota bacterium]
MPGSKDSLLRALNPEQRDAVRHTEGPLLVLAGAGSGKTRVITTRIAYLIEKGLAAPSEILGVTFTNKAATEMRERVAGLIGKQRAKPVVLSTFHSFCVRVLRAEIEHVGYRRNFTISSESDARTLVRRALQDLDGVRESFDPGAFLEQIGMMKCAALEPGEEPPPAPKADAPAEETDTAKKYRTWLPEIYGRYQSALRAANTVDFDDLLLLTLKLWREHPRVLARYQHRFRYVLVDEYQDTNQVQYRLLAALTAKHHNLCVVGDDDQSIYSWRGADIGNILSFERDFPSAKIVKLEQNYRSTETILSAANSVIARNTARRPKNLWSRLGPGRPIDRFVTGDAEHEAKEAAAWLRHIQARAGAPYRDFAILYRSNLQSRPFEIAFRQAGIPYVVVGGQEFFDRAEIKDLLAYLKVIANPRDEASFLRVVNVPRRGIGDTTLLQAHDLCRQGGVSLGKALSTLLERDTLAANTKAGIRRFLGVLAEFRKRFRACDGHLADTATALLDAIAYRDELFRTCKSTEQFDARWANVEALLAALAEYESAAQPATLSGFLDESALVNDDDRRSRDERRHTGVTLMTVHSAKGLEFPFVFIVGLEEGLLPHEKSLRDGGIEEERRLFYVALTRGKRHVTLFEALSRERYGRERMSTPSRFIDEIPSGLIHTRVRAAKDMVAERVDAPGKKPASRRRPGRRR